MATSRPQRQRQSRSSSAAQVGLALLMAEDVKKALALLDPTDLPGTLPKFTRVVHVIVVRYSRMSSTLAARLYGQARRDAGLTDRPPFQIPPDPTLQQVQAAVSRATRPLRTTATPEQVNAAAKAVTAEAESVVLKASHATTLETVFADRGARGYAYVPEPDCCYLCAMLATRGEVYKADSFDRSDKRFTGPGHAKVHDNCRCDLEPVFTAYEPTARIRQWRALYHQATASEEGSDKRRAFRRAFEGQQRDQAVPAA